MKGVPAIALLLASLTLAAAETGTPGAKPSPQRGRAAVSRFDPASELTSYDGSFHFCRIWYRNGLAGDGDGWFVDYPRADENLSIRLAELTRTPVTNDFEGNPDHFLVKLSAPSLFQCPFTMMSEPGGAYFDDVEAANLRAYLLKGGFLWVDDFWGEVAWRNWETQIRKALPAADYPIRDLTTAHPMFHTLFNIEELPQIPNVGLWMRYRETSERGPASVPMHARAISDSHGRVMVFMTHNTDFGDAYEREAESPEYFQHFSMNAYAIGIDVILYALTH